MKMRIYSSSTSTLAPLKETEHEILVLEHINEKSTFIENKSFWQSCITVHKDMFLN